MGAFSPSGFFFINYAWKNSYKALSVDNDNLITIKEGDCYVSQPYGGYALRCDSRDKSVVFGVLIKKDVFFKEFLSLVYAETVLFNFFIKPRGNKFSEEIIFLPCAGDHAMRTILELMVIEYANKNDDTQRMLKTLFTTLFLQIGRKYSQTYKNSEPDSLCSRMLKYIEAHSDTVSLKELSKHFFLHPNYISSLISKHYGQTFSSLLLENRMRRSMNLLKTTNLSIEGISSIVGYADNSSFYKAFRKYYNESSRRFIKHDV